jgi:predicted nucleotidyltransferase
MSPEECVRAVCAERYADAGVVFLAGSVVRGEGTAFSDLDLVVVYESLHHAYRESFVAHDWPVEAFVHDPQTLSYFMGTDRANGIPTLASMIVDGIPLPAANPVSRLLKQSAAEVLKAGPPVWTDKERSWSRYIITDLVEDLRAPRSAAEFQASASRLYEMLANHFFRSRGLWSAKGKRIVRCLQAVDGSFTQAFTNSFETAFMQSDPSPLIAISETALRADGGFLFDGYRADAPQEWRAP